MQKTIYPPRAGARKRPPRVHKKRLKPIQSAAQPKPHRYLRLYLEQEGLCFYCRQPMELPNDGNFAGRLPGNRITKEHLFAATSDRRYRKYVVAACHSCNQERGSDYHWREFMIRKIEQYWTPR
ncbi:MAG: hypothetical protein KDJ47_16805 [Hyphomicrobiaceae bacterium]|nr:hypothetical protein [Hyphomicrobiaceae bacterium]